MAKEPSIVITGLGMRCSVGQNVTQSCASVRAGVSRFAEWKHLSAPGDAATGLVVAAARPDLGNDHWIEKFEELAMQPFLEALWTAKLSHLRQPSSPVPWGLYLATPSNDRPGVESNALTDFEKEAQEKMLLTLIPDELKLFPNEHAGGLLALEHAMQQIAQGEIGIAVVGGMDSLLHSEYLFDLFHKKKLKTDVTPAGLIAGEAASFIVLENAAMAERRGAPVLARMTQVRTAKESNPAGQPSKGEALTEVVRQAVEDAPCGMENVHCIMTDLNGERWRFLEWSIAYSKMPPAMPVHWQFQHPADCLGDIGAATGPSLLCIATRAFQRGYAVGEALPICVSSDSGERAAVCVLPA